jgi:hypothetical protein
MTWAVPVKDMGEVAIDTGIHTAGGTPVRERGRREEPQPAAFLVIPK